MPAIGLSEAEAARRIAQYGENRFVQIQKVGPIEVIDYFLSNFQLPAIILAIELIWLLTVDLLLATAAFAIILLTAICETATDVYRANAIRDLQLAHHGKALVVRDGLVKDVDCWRVVPGDVVLLNPGDRIPCDGEILEGRIRCDEEVFGRGTVERRTVSSEELKLIEFEKKPDPSKVFAGTFVLDGHAKVCARATGLATDYAKISLPYVHERELTSRVREANSVIFWVVLIAAMTIGALLAVRAPLLDTVLVATAAAYVGFPALGISLINTCYFRTAQRIGIVLRREKVLDVVRKIDLVAIEPRHILTEGRPTVGRIFIDGEFVDVSGKGWEKGEIKGGTPKSIEELATACALISEATIVHNEEGKLTAYGSPIDCALAIFATKARLPIESVRADWPCAVREKKEILHAVYVRRREKLSYLFGPARDVLKECTKIQVRGEITKLKQKEMRDIEHRIAQLTADGYEVWAIAKGVAKGATFFALLGIYDPVRDDVISSIKELRALGIKVILLSEESETIAIRTARETGIMAEGRALLCHLLDDMKLRERTEAIAKTVVFARAEPRWQKVIIEELKKEYCVALIETVGYDLSVMRASHVAITTESSPDILKFNSDAIIKDDSLSNFVKAIKYIRELKDDSERAFCALFAFNFSILIFLLLSTVLALELPNLLHILILNFIGDSAAIALVIAQDKEHERMVEAGRDKEFPSIKNLTFAIFAATYIGIVATFLNFVALGAAIVGIAAMIAALLLSYSTKRPIVAELPSKNILATAMMIIAVTLILVYVSAIFFPESPLALQMPPSMLIPVFIAAFSALLLGELKEIIL